MKEPVGYRKERKEVARFMRRLYRQNLTTTSGGNISLRISKDMILITPSATDKGRMRWKEVGIMSILGENLTPELKPSIESEMHLSIYRRKKDVLAIVHAHPVVASSFTAMDLTLRTDLTAEARAICGTPVLVPYALMGTRDLAAVAADSIGDSNILLLENHGILTTGNTLLEAFDRLEVLENAAIMTLLVEITGKKKPLGKMRIREIEKFFR
ncbi:MAG: class II aldolase/adducin family protein [Bacteroidales bacterium]|nr:class II aldolase/adducin family protein [Bacteroidales bacterium]